MKLQVVSVLQPKPTRNTPDSEQGGFIINSKKAPESLLPFFLGWPLQAYSVQRLEKNAVCGEGDLSQQQQKGLKHKKYQAILSRWNSAVVLEYPDQTTFNFFLIKIFILR